MFFLLVLLFFSAQIHSFSPSAQKKLLCGTIMGGIIIGSFYLFKKYYKKNDKLKTEEIDTILKNIVVENPNLNHNSTDQKAELGDNEQKYALRPIEQSDIQEIIEKYQRFDLTGVEEKTKEEYLKTLKKSRKNFLTTMLGYDLHQKVIDRKNNILGYIICQSYYGIPFFLITDGHSVNEVGTLLLDNIIPRVKEAHNKDTTKRRFFEIKFDKDDKNLEERKTLFEKYGFKQLPCRLNFNPPQLVWAIEWEDIQK